MSDEKNKKVKAGVGVAGKVIKWVLIALLAIVIIVFGYSCYTCTAVTKAVVDTASSSQLVKDAVKEAVSEANGGQDTAKIIVEAVKISPKDLFAAYESNELKADNTEPVSKSVILKPALALSRPVGCKSALL
jgi:hypothetical protein